jgi:hypothetical protein
MSDEIVRAIRTYVPLLVGGLVANLPFLDGVINTDALVLAVVGLYYTAAAVLERWYPWFGWLLGRPKTR